MEVSITVKNRNEERDHFTVQGVQHHFDTPHPYVVSSDEIDSTVKLWGELDHLYQERCNFPVWKIEAEWNEYISIEHDSLAVNKVTMVFWIQCDEQLMNVIAREYLKVFPRTDLRRRASSCCCYYQIATGVARMNEFDKIEAEGILKAILDWLNSPDMNEYKVVVTCEGEEVFTFVEFLSFDIRNETEGRVMKRIKEIERNKQNLYNEISKNMLLKRLTRLKRFGQKTCHLNSLLRQLPDGTVRDRGIVSPREIVFPGGRRTGIYEQHTIPTMETLKSYSLEELLKRFGLKLKKGSKK